MIPRRMSRKTQAACPDRDSDYVYPCDAQLPAGDQELSDAARDIWRDRSISAHVLRCPS